MLIKLIFVFELQICPRSKMLNNATSGQMTRLNSKPDPLTRDGLHNSCCIPGKKDTASTKTARDSSNRERVHLNL